MIAKFFMILLVASAIIISSCGDSKKEENKEKKDTTEQKTEGPEVTINPVIPDGFVDKELKEFGLDAAVKCPAEAYIYTSELQTDEGKQQQIVIQFDSSSDIKFYISKTAVDFAKVKEEIEKNMFLEFKRFLVEDENGVVYEAMNKSDETLVYNFAMILKGKDSNYKVESDTFVNLTPEQISTLYAMAKSITIK